MLSNNENKELTLEVFNIFENKIKSIKITPTKNWPNSNSLIGAILRFE